jgi:hypothetical protein
MATETPHNEEEQLIERTLHYLATFAEPNHLELNTNPAARDAFKLIAHISLSHSGIQKTLNLTHMAQFWPVITRTLSQEYEILNKKLATNKNPYPSLEDIELTSILVSIIRMFSNACINFCAFFMENGGIDLLFKFLQNERIVTALVKLHKCNTDLTLNDEDLKARLELIIRGLLGCLINLGKLYCTTKQFWRKTENRVVQTLLELGTQLKTVIDCQFAAFIVLALISDDSLTQMPQFEEVQLPTMCQVIGRIARLTENLCQMLIINNRAIKRIPMHMNVNDSEYRDVAVIEVDSSQWNLVELLNALYRMAVNDRIKQDIYEKYDLSSHIRVFLYKGNDTEAEYAAKLLWQLCFDKTVAAQVRDDYELIARLEFLNHYSPNVYLKRNCSGILWQLNHETSDTKPDVDEASEEGFKDDKHIMISYNSGSRVTCLKIKKELETQGHRVWIDVESIHGSSLESMASAIENSWCVLMCMTENYKQSTNCRAEAEYAFQLNKPIVPLVIKFCILFCCLKPKVDFI